MVKETILGTYSTAWCWSIDRQLRNGHELRLDHGGAWERLKSRCPVLQTALQAPRTGVSLMLLLPQGAGKQGWQQREPTRARRGSCPVRWPENKPLGGNAGAEGDQSGKRLELQC